MTKRHTCPGVADQWSSEWVGLDGYNDQTVEQEGTSAWCGGSGDTTPKYDAWYEMFPAGSVNVFAVHPGDVIDASTSYSDSTGDFTLTVSDLSTGKSSSTTTTCASCTRASAEWIIERSALCNSSFTKCFITELADFGTSTMSGDEAQVNGGTLKGVGAFNNDAIDIVNPDANGDGGFYSLDTVGPLAARGRPGADRRATFRSESMKIWPNGPVVSVPWLRNLHRTGEMMTASRTFKIAAIPADGVGREVVAAGREVLDALAAGSGGAFAFDWQEFGWGCEYYARTGRMMAEDGLTVLKDFDAIYFGAVGWPGVPDHISLWGLRLAICQNFDQWANVRPVRFLPGVRSPLRRADVTDLDWVVVRENSEGEYAGLGGRNLSGRGPGSEVAVQSALFTEFGCERIMRFAFELARTRTRRKVSSVTKSNAQQFGMVLWDDVFRRVARDYPDVETESVLVDAMSAKFVLRPEDLSVVVASNLHADILSDLGSALAGSLGLAASANLNPERRYPSMFEPVHGSAPDIAGQGLANPIGAVGSAAMMLDHLGLPGPAARIHAAIEATTAAGVLTRDVGGTASTGDVTKALIGAL